MTQTMVLDIVRQGFFTIIIVSLPVLLTSMAVGLVISILQAVTQVQEQTLSFVPKLIAVMLALVIFGNFMLNQLISLANSMFRIIENIV
ncbi:flagellar biosynthesis protein FliQ [Gudongella oleilytica]|uniref:flagellar biosynthesis protein FliQ n=1 Tax=Gudongella oleilytica TaxID=1582259 RepID=UPI002A36E152|nr:flagellar biosynthesis protein FliQ [Gudongella oleilytica]MDY0256569.1 flagellar biosynthesis protein FliQ [Gudongella oleilytica]HMM68986.1 flagellar biosynthesis protein FliQ [Gudongella oleilytica]